MPEPFMLTDGELERSAILVTQHIDRYVADVAGGRAGGDPKFWIKLGSACLARAEDLLTSIAIEHGLDPDEIRRAATR